MAGGRRQARRWAAVLFDLDGTLVDTRPGIREALRKALAEAGENPDAAERADLTRPLDEMVRSALPDASDALRERVKQGFRQHYDSTCWSVATAYEGASECLVELSAAGLRCFVVTNKRANVAKRLLEYLGLACYFEDVVGQPEHGEAVSKAELGGWCLAGAGLDPAETVVVGDSKQDAAMASALNTELILVTYGTERPGRAPAGQERLQADDLPEVTKLLLRGAAGGNDES